MGLIGNYFYCGTKYWSGKIVERESRYEYMVQYIDPETEQDIKIGILNLRSIKKYDLCKTKEEVFKQYQEDCKREAIDREREEIDREIKLQREAIALQKEKDQKLFNLLGGVLMSPVIIIGAIFTVIFQWWVKDENDYDKI